MDRVEEVGAGERRAARSSPRRRRRGLPAGRRAPSPRAAAALLPDARLAPRRRGRLAGHVARRLAWPHGVRGALITADVAVPGGNQPVSEHPARQPEAAGREPAAARRRGAGAEPHRRGDLAGALSRRAAGWAQRAARARRPLRGERSDLDRVPDRTPGAVGAPAGCPHPARRPRLPRPRGRHDPRCQRGIGHRAPSNGRGPSSSNGSPQPQNTSRRHAGARPRNARSSTASPAPTSPATSTRSWPCSPTTSP